MFESTISKPRLISKYFSTRSYLARVEKYLYESRFWKQYFPNLAKYFHYCVLYWLYLYYIVYCVFIYIGYNLSLYIIYCVFIYIGYSLSLYIFLIIIFSWLTSWLSLIIIKNFYRNSFYCLRNPFIYHNTNKYKKYNKPEIIHRNIN